MTVRITFTFGLLTTIYNFYFPTILIVILAILNDGTMLTISKVRARASPHPPTRPPTCARTREASAPTPTYIHIQRETRPLCNYTTRLTVRPFLPHPGPGQAVAAAGPVARALYVPAVVYLRPVPDGVHPRPLCDCQQPQLALRPERRAGAQRQHVRGAGSPPWPCLHAGTCSPRTTPAPTCRLRDFGPALAHSHTCMRALRGPCGSAASALTGPAWGGGGGGVAMASCRCPFRARRSSL
jgi:hypothetical protein